MRRGVRMAVCVAAFGLLSSADSPAVAQEQAGSPLDVLVRSASGDPVAGATVTAVWLRDDGDAEDARREEERITSEGGLAHFDEVGPGTVRVRALRAGWKPNGVDLEIAGEPRKIELELQARGGVEVPPDVAARSAEDAGAEPADED